MRAALGLARRGLGRTWPNPSVGAVLVRDGRVVGRGHTAPGGRPHAETQAIAMAGDLARDSTLYVTLEPCSHHGRTPPCADAVIAAGIKRVLVAQQDPDPRVSGAGLARLRQAGLAVELGLGADLAQEINQGFFLTRLEKRPLVTLKLATSLDGRIAAANGASKWITGPQARAHAHAMRANHDGVLAGIGTVLVDDPELTCRLPGMEGIQPVSVVLDTHLRLPPSSKLALAAHARPVWLVTGADPDSGRAAALTGLGVRIVSLSHPGRPDPAALLSALADLGLTRLMVEGGGQVAAAFVQAGLVDRLIWYRAPALMGGDGLAALAELGLHDPARMMRFSLTKSLTLGKDAVDFFQRT